MKKLLFLLALVFTVNFAVKAQDDDKMKTKKTSTPTQKMHNAVSKHKKYKGTKTKAKTDDGKMKMTENDKTGKTEMKDK